jgi:outer membrane usher protein FimD/PapC
MRCVNFLQVSLLVGGVLLFMPAAARTELPSETGSHDSGAVVVEFDSDMLRGRNIDAKLAHYFSTGARFTEGRETVSLYVNGQPRGRFWARFDSSGELIFTEKLLTVAKLKQPESAGADTPVSFERFLKAYPTTEVSLKPGQREVRLIVPTDALLKDDVDMSAFDQGGTAALLNYNLMGVDNSFNGTNSEFRYLDTVAGFNAGDWIVRSRQSYSVQDEISQVSYMYAYAQKNITSLKSTFQVGEINLGNSLFSGAGITGVQLVPEAGLRRLEQGNGAEVEGVANSTARVEVWQTESLIYSTVVAAGPFKLTDLPLRNVSSDLNVRIIEADGHQRSFSVPAASFAGGIRDSVAGYSLAVGQYRAEESEKPNVLTASGTWNLGRNTSASAGVLMADGYDTLGWASDFSLASDIRLGLRQVFSHADVQDDQGALSSATLHAQLTPRLSLGMSATQRTRGYLELAETAYRQDEAFLERLQNKAQYTASAGWTNPVLGHFHLAYSQSEQFDGLSAQRLTGGWSKNIGDTTVSLGIEKGIHEMDKDDESDRVNLSVSFPLGGARIRTYASHDYRGTRTGANYSQTVSETLSYRVQAERDSADRETDLSITANVLPHYTNASVGYSRSGSRSESYNGSLSGGIVAHADGVTFSPYQVEDTFSIISVDDLAGVRVTTSLGPVWTDVSGRAVASRLRPYQNNHLQIAAESLPRNVDIVNGYKALKVGRGSVSHVDFDVVKSRRILMQATYENGSPLLKGASVFAGSHYLTTVVDHGQIFVPNIEPGERLTVESAAGTTCELDFELPEEAQITAYFESVNAICRSARG